MSTWKQLPTAEPSGERRSELLELAREEFSKRGYAATSTRDLARRLGILRGSLYHHIDSKESLLFETMRGSFVPGLTLVQELRASRGSTRDRLRRLVTGHVGAMASDAAVLGLVFDEADALSPEHRAIVAELEDTYVTAVRDVLEVGRDAGEVRAGVELDIATRHLLGAMNWMYRWYRDDGRLSSDVIATAFSDILVAGLRSDGTAAGAVGGARSVALAERALAARGVSESSLALDRLLTAAAELFAQRGVAGTSMQDIASALGVRKANLYRHIDSKEQLLYELADRVLAGTLASMAMIRTADADALTRLAAAIACHAATIEDYPAQTRLILHERRSLSAEHQRNLATSERRLHRNLLFLLEEAQRTGQISTDRDARLAVLCALGSVNWMYRWYRPGRRLDGLEIGHELAELLIFGLVTET